ncbi:MAG: mechanosensitive ion channel family protein, partial [Clostridia bacterium]|nr:mechanosensitive ion channel family protein [Clostridia bacterium]
MTSTVKSIWSWLSTAPKEGPVDFVLKVILALVVYVIGSKLIGWLCRILRKQMLRFGTDEAAKSFLLSLIKISLHIVLILTIAGNLGVDKTSVAALVGSAGVAVSLALQGGLSNFAGGLIIMFLRPFSVGDYI